MKFTLDWNFLIEVAEERPQADDVRELVAAHRTRRIELALMAASASENTRSKVFPGNAKLFLQRVAQMGWDDLPLVPMPAIIGLSYIDHAYWVDSADEFERKFNALWQVIAPRFARTARSHLASGQEFDDAAIQSEGLSKWRNRWCDVMSACTHIHEKRDVFVTNNTRDFQDNAEALVALGMTRVAKPAEAVKFLNTISSQ